MSEDKQKNDLGTLSQAWSERVKGIRRRVQKDGPDVIADSSIGSSLPDEELFAGTVYEDFSAQQVFSGGEDFYKSPEQSPAAASPRSSAPPPKIQHGPTRPAMKLLIGMLILIVLVVLSYELLTHFSVFPAAGPSPASASPQTASHKPEPDALASTQEPTALLSEDHPVSLKIAQDYYQQGDYNRACAVYKQLIGKFPKNTDEDGLRDFLKLKMALCLEKTADDEQSADVLKTVLKSRSAIVRVLANYHLCRLEMQKQQYLTARSRAYQAMALLDAMGPEVNRVKDLRRDCSFLAAEAISREALSLSDADKGSPTKLWPRFDTENDSLSDMDELALRTVLNAGVQQLNQSLLGPKIEAGGTDGNRTWMVNCNGASIDEMMSRFSVNSGYDVHWGTNAAKTGIRDRSVSLYLIAAPDRHCVVVAAGCAGLLATLDDNNMITLRNPAEYTSVSEQISLLCEEAVSCWQQYLLVYYDDSYLANVHFVLGQLKAVQGRLAEALPEYKMVANRFMNSGLAPDALMNSAKLKAGLQDYPGAYRDLKEAVEQYPDYEKIDRAYLLVADAAVRIGHGDEAAKLYSKVYYLNNSAETQSAAALAAGQIFYQGQDFVNAEKWFTRYITLEKDKKGYQFYQVCLLLGKTWQMLGNSQLACDALRTSLAGQLPQKDFVEAVSVLVEGYTEQGDFVGAIEMLNEASSRQLSQEESVRMLLLKSRSLRGIGLIDKAIVLLREREEYLIDNALKARIGYELSECYSEQGDLDLAYKKLTKTLEWAAPGPTTHKTLYKLADVCLQTGLDSQARAVCSQLLGLQPPEPIRQKTLELLATVYNKQKDYDRAALALLGQWQ